MSATSPTENPYAAPSESPSPFGTVSGDREMGLLGFLFGFSGRVARRPFALAMFGFVFPVVGAGEVLAPYLPMVVLAPLKLVGIWSFYAVIAKRWHDQDRRGWHTLWLIVPLANVVALLFLFFQHSSTSQRFGPTPGSFS